MSTLRSDHTGTGAYEESTVRYTRSPRDLLRLVVFAATAIMIAALTVWAEDAVLALEGDVIRLVDFLSGAPARILHGLGEGLLISVSIFVYTVPIVTRRYRLLGYAVAAATASFVAMQALDALLDRAAPTTIVNQLAARSGITDLDTGAAGVAQVSALFVVAGVWVALSRPALGVHFPSDVFAGFCLGAGFTWFYARSFARKRLLFGFDEKGGILPRYLLRAVAKKTAEGGEVR